MHDGTQLLADHAERNDAVAVAVDDRLDLGARLIDRAMDETLQIGLAAARDGHPLMGELHDVGGFNELGRAPAREQELSGIVGMADADMAEGIADLFRRQDAVGDHQLVDGSLEAGHGPYSANPRFGLQDEAHRAKRAELMGIDDHAPLLDAQLRALPLQDVAIGPDIFPHALV